MRGRVQSPENRIEQLLLRGDARFHPRSHEPRGAAVAAPVVHDALRSPPGDVLGRRMQQLDVDVLQAAQLVAVVRTGARQRHLDPAPQQTPRQARLAHLPPGLDQPFPGREGSVRQPIERGDRREEVRMRLPQFGEQRRVVGVPPRLGLDTGLHRTEKLR